MSRNTPQTDDVVFDLADTSDPDLDDELIAALGESRLSPGEEGPLVERLARNPVARAGFRDLYPARFNALFNERDEVLAKIRPFPGRQIASVLPPPRSLGDSTGSGLGLDAMPPSRPAWRLLGFGLVASFTILFALVAPASAPRFSQVVYDPMQIRGGVERVDDDRVRGPAVRSAEWENPVPLAVDLGEVSRWERLRGHTPWGAIVVALPGERPTVLATSARPGTCTATDTTLACLSRTRYAGIAVVVSSGPADAPVDALVTGSESWEQFQLALKATATHEAWNLHFPLENPVD